MEQKENICISCGTMISRKGSTIFSCPNCGKVKMTRCERCRDQSVKYRCSECGFIGP